MADCQCLVGCPFFRNQMGSMPATAELLKDRLCHTDHTKCARYMVAQALGRARVPPNLYPDDIEKAREIIKAGQSSKSPVPERR